LVMVAGVVGDAGAVQAVEAAADLVRGQHSVSRHCHCSSSESGNVAWKMMILEPLL